VIKRIKQVRNESFEDIFTTKKFCLGVVNKINSDQLFFGKVEIELRTSPLNLLSKLFL